MRRWFQTLFARTAPYEAAGARPQAGARPKGERAPEAAEARPKGERATEAAEACPEAEARPKAAEARPEGERAPEGVAPPEFDGAAFHGMGLLEVQVPALALCELIGSDVRSGIAMSLVHELGHEGTLEPPKLGARFAAWPYERRDDHPGARIFRGARAGPLAPGETRRAAAVRARGGHVLALSVTTRRQRSVVIHKVEATAFHSAARNRPRLIVEVHATPGGVTETALRTERRACPGDAVLQQGILLAILDITSLLEKMEGCRLSDFRF